MKTMKNIYTSIFCPKKFLFKTLFSSIFFFTFFTGNAQQYTEAFTSSPVLTAPWAPSWLTAAAVTQGGTDYVFENWGNGGWDFQTSGGAGNSSSLRYVTAATTAVRITRKDGKRFQFYGAWLKYTNYSDPLYVAPWLRVTYEGSRDAVETYGNNTTVTLSKNVCVTGVTIYFSGLNTLNFDNVILGPAIPIAPFPETYEVSLFSNNSATFSGSVTDDGGAAVTESGIVYSTSPSPTVANTKVPISSGVTYFEQEVSGLQSNTTYYAKAYAINSAGTSYGDETTVTTFGTFTTSGPHNFNTAWVSSTYQTSPFTKYVEGFDITGVSTGAGAISVYRLTSIEAGEGAATPSISSDGAELTYMSMKLHDGSAFNLDGFKYRYDVLTPGTSFGTITVTGYKNGVAVPGAVQVLNNISPTSTQPSYKTFTPTPGLFVNIDEYRLTASNSANSAELYSFDMDAVSLSALASLPVTFTTVKAYQQNAGIQVDWNVAAESNIDHYEVEKSANGQQFVKTTSVAAKANNAATGSYNWFDAKAFAGNNFYRIRSVSNSGEVKNSRVINVNIREGKESISVNPNPVSGNTINLQFINQLKGTYTIQLYTNTGQQVYNKTIEHAGGSATQTLELSNNIAQGVFQLRISNGSTSYTQQVIKN